MSEDFGDPLVVGIETSDERTLVTLSGELDASTAATLYSELAELELAEVRNVVLDLAKVTFMDSTGLSVIITEHKRLQHSQGQLTIFSPPSSVRRLFEVSGLTPVLDIVPADEER
jgi:anti-anti-sigma factor